MHIYPQRTSLQELGSEIFKLVSYSSTPEQWAEWLRVPLEHAAARGNLNLVNTLLKAGADGSAGWRGCRGRTLLDAAAVGGSAGVVTALLGAGAQPDVNVVSLSPKRSALYVAMVCGHEEVARRLIQAGADVSFEDPVDQCSVLHEAACWGNEQLVNDLLVGGADPTCFADKYGTPLHQAAAAGHPAIVSALLASGVDTDVLDRRHGTTPLICAALKGRLAAVNALLAAGADFNMRERNDGASLSASALDLAAFEGHIPVMNAIIRHGADVNSRDDDGCSALHSASRGNAEGAIEALIDAGAEIELEAHDGATPLHHAAYFGRCKSMRALLRRGAVVGAHDKFGQTPLHWACRLKLRGMAAAVDLLLRWGADETAVKTSGETPAVWLDLDPVDNEHLNPIRCSRQELERTRQLLERAPADRAWRRRCWLVVLRSRAAKEGACCHGDGGGGGSNSSVVGGAVGVACKTAKTDGPGRVSSGVRGQFSHGGVGITEGGESEVGGLSGLVDQLLGLELEGVFRTIVGFL
eukprot:g12779.t1